MAGPRRQALPILLVLDIEADLPPSLGAAASAPPGARPWCADDGVVWGDVDGSAPHEPAPRPRTTEVDTRRWAVTGVTSPFSKSRPWPQDCCDPPPPARAGRAAPWGWEPDELLREHLGPAPAEGRAGPRPARRDPGGKARQPGGAARPSYGTTDVPGNCSEPANDPSTSPHTTRTVGPPGRGTSATRTHTMPRPLKTLRRVQ